MARPLHESIKLCTVSCKLFVSVSLVDSFVSDHHYAERPAHHAYAATILCFFRGWRGCTPLLFLFDMLCIMV